MNRFDAERVKPGVIFPDDPLIKATEENDIDGIKQLLIKGGDVNCVTWTYGRGLQCFVKSHDAFSIIIEAGLVVDEKTLIDFLTGVGESDFSCEILQRLIDLGAPINGASKNLADSYHKQWPINETIIWRRLRYAEILLQNGADPNRLFIPEHLTPLHFSAMHWATEILDKRLRIFTPIKPACDLLLKYGAEIDAVAKDGKTPLLKAASEMVSDAVEYFVSHGANLLQVDNAGKGALSLASEKLKSRGTWHTAKNLVAFDSVYKKCLEKYYVIDMDTGEISRR